MRSISKCFNMVYLAGGFTCALNYVLRGAERERLGLPILRRNVDEVLVVGKSFVLEQRLSSCIWGVCDKQPLLRKRFRGCKRIEAPPMPWLTGNCRTDAPRTTPPQLECGGCCSKR
jgi:hypothetical protein